MASKIDIRQIIKDHRASLRQEQTQEQTSKEEESPRLSNSDIFYFRVLPYSIGFVLAIFGIKIGSLAPMLTSSLSILMGLMLNSIVILMNILRNSDRERPTETTKNTILKETLANISFTILLAILCILLLVLTQLPMDDWGYGGAILSFFIHFFTFSLLTLFLLTLLMVVKRVYSLFLNEMGN